MRRFSEIRQDVEEKKGDGFLERKLKDPLNNDEIEQVADDRWLAEFTKCVFQAGFRWQIIEDKWDKFEKAFDGFDLYACRMMSDEDIDRLMSEKAVVANYVKIRTVRENASALLDFVDEFGSVGAYFSKWETENYCDNIVALRKVGSRLGGNTGLIALRRLGVDSLIFSNDVVKALIREGVVSKASASKRDLKALQHAINKWHDEEGTPLNHISQILAFSV